MKKNITVLGAGVQGCCVALELANRGYSVQLLDQDAIPFNRSSIRNEGKIHLGLVYVNDQGFDTPELMLRAAFRFTPFLSRWIGEKSADLNTSTPFYYLVSKDSFLDANQLEERYEILEEKYCQQRKEDPHSNYLGTQPGRLAQRSSEEELAHHFRTDELQGGFLTPELAIDTSKVARHISEAVNNHPNILFLSGHKIESISKNSSDFFIEGVNKDGRWKIKSLQVVNATWTDKYRLDETLGIPAPKGILHRLKYRVVAEIPTEMKNYPSATMVIGRFGDVVIRPDNTVYISWYPDACRGWSNSINPPESWDKPSTGHVSKEDFRQFSEKFINETAKWYPAVKNCKPKIVDAGIIVASGKTDVDDENSELHKRSKIGVTSYGGYHSVETGKFTTAPMFAMETADHVDEVFKQL